MFRPSKTTVIGLDIEPGYVAAVESRGGDMVVQRAAVAPLPEGAVKDGEVVDPQAVGAVLRAMFHEHKLGDRVRVGVANQRVVMRTIELPPLTDEKQLASAVRFQAQEHIAMPLAQAVLEHHSLGVVGTEAGPRSRVVLVAAHREMIARVLEAVREGGLRPEGIDVSAFALIRALRRPSDGDESVAYVNLGGLTNLAVATGPICVFTRVVNTGFHQLVSELAERRGLTREHSLAWLRHAGAANDPGEIDGDPQIVQSARQILSDGATRIAAEVLATLDFHASQIDAAGAHRAVLTGPGVSIPGFAERLGQELRLPVEVRVATGQPGSAGDIDLSQLSVAAGLTTTEAVA
jgi:type IV pilus assembly protein PilM